MKVDQWIRDWIVEMRDDGMTFRQIASRLQADQVPTARGGQWQAGTVMRIWRHSKGLPHRYPAAERRNALWRNYRITPQEYDKMYYQQNGLCAICEDPKEPWELAPRRGSTRCKYLVVDHDHATGKVRELLCTACNSGLGQFRENPEFLLAAVDYLRYHVSEAALSKCQPAPSWAFPSFLHGGVWQQLSPIPAS